MPRAGQLIRDLARDRARDSEAEVLRRLRERAAGAQAHEEALELFGGVTSENVAEVLRWQEARRAELLA